MHIEGSKLKGANRLNPVTKRRGGRAREEERREEGPTENQEPSTPREKVREPSRHVAKMAGLYRRKETEEQGSEALGLE